VHRTERALHTGALRARAKAADVPVAMSLLCR
jgi:hypothetical protein